MELVGVRNVLGVERAPFGGVEQPLVDVAVAAADGGVDDLVAQVERVHEVDGLGPDGAQL